MSERISRLTDLSDEALMARYAKDDDAAFEVLLSRYRRPLFGFLYRYLGQMDKAEDVFQEVFYEVIRARRRFRVNSKFSGWLFRIARNRAVDRLRRDGFREMESLDGPAGAADQGGQSRLDMLPGGDPGPEEAFKGLELREALEAALASLPAEQREVLWLKEKGGLTLADVADLVGVSENTVKSRLRYALEKLRANLARKGLQL